MTKIKPKVIAAVPQGEVEVDILRRKVLEASDALKNTQTEAEKLNNEARLLRTRLQEIENIKLKVVEASERLELARSEYMDEVIEKNADALIELLPPSSEPCERCDSGKGHTYDSEGDCPKCLILRYKSEGWRGTNHKLVIKFEIVDRW